MAQRSVPALVPPSGQLVAVRVAPVCAGTVRAAVPAGRGPQSVAPATSRRDPVRPGARPARSDGLAGPRPVRGGCSAEAVARPAAGARRGRPAEHLPVRLTERGRRVVAGLSIAIGLSIAAATVVTVQVGGHDGGLELAGSSTVVVRPGDTLWSLAQQAAPEEDTRAVVDAIVDLNGLDDVDLLPGAVLRLP